MKPLVQIRRSPSPPLPPEIESEACVESEAGRESEVSVEADEDTQILGDVAPLRTRRTCARYRSQRGCLPTLAACQGSLAYSPQIQHSTQIQLRLEPEVSGSESEPLRPRQSNSL